MLRIHYYYLPHIQSILSVVFRESPDPVLCISREDKYNYLNIKGKFPVKVTNYNTSPATDSAGAGNANRLLSDIHKSQTSDNQSLTLNNKYMTINHIF